jgi:methionyl-tRNA formyltransferase
LSTWRIVFMGTPVFARPVLEALLAGPDPVVGVVCQPDRPQGRGLDVTPPVVKQVALAHGLPVLQPQKIRSADFEQALRELAPDLAVVAAFGRILPRAILDIPTHGSINVHGSLLPRHRGAAPIEWAILAGDAETGVTIMSMTEELDAGDMLLRRAVPITDEDTAGTLAPALAALGAEAIGEAIAGLKAGAIIPVPQPAAGVTYAPRIERAHLAIDWTRPARELARQVRAFAPRPGAFTTLTARHVKIHRARVEATPAGAPPGTVLSAGPDGVLVATGEERLRLLELQLEGRKRLEAAAFLAGQPLRAGTCLGAD